MVSRKLTLPHQDGAGFLLYKSLYGKDFFKEEGFNADLIKKGLRRSGSEAYSWWRSCFNADLIKKGLRRYGGLVDTNQTGFNADLIKKGLRHVEKRTENIVQMF